MNTQHEKIAGQAWLRAFIVSPVAPVEEDLPYVAAVLHMFDQRKQFATPDMAAELCAKFFNLYCAYGDRWPELNKLTNNVLNMFPAEFRAWQKMRLDTNLYFPTLAADLTAFYRLDQFPNEPPALFSDRTLSKHQNLFTSDATFGDAIYAVKDSPLWAECVAMLVERILQSGSTRTIEDTNGQMRFFAGALPNDLQGKYGTGLAINTLKAFWSEKSFARTCRKALKKCRANQMRDIPTYIVKTILAEEHAELNHALRMDYEPILNILLEQCMVAATGVVADFMPGDITFMENMAKCLTHIRSLPNVQPSIKNFDAMFAEFALLLVDLCRDKVMAAKVLARPRLCDVILQHGESFDAPTFTDAFLIEVHAEQLASSSKSLSVYNVMQPDAAIKLLVKRLLETESDESFIFLCEIFDAVVEGPAKSLRAVLLRDLAQEPAFKSAVLRFLAAKPEKVPPRFRTYLDRRSWCVPEKNPILPVLQAAYPLEQERWALLECVCYQQHEKFTEAAFSEVLDLFTGSREPTLKDVHAMVGVLNDSLELNASVGNIVGNLVYTKAVGSIQNGLADVEFTNDSPEC